MSGWRLLERLLWNWRRSAAAVVAAVVVITVLVALLTSIRGSHHPAQAVPRPAPPTASVAAQSAAQGSSPLAGSSGWLPFTQQDLDAAASVTVKFAVDYDTYSYTETAAAYVGKMNGLITAQLAATLRDDYSTPGVARLRTSQKQVSTGTATIDSVRAFGPESLTFLVDTTQQLVTAGGTSTGNAQYAVTVTGSGLSWQVSDIELASTGNS
jgi:hypothetical protein